ncbi:aspartoacylase-like isoform X1 [Ptychodera flava]|uniref:aspartoacylase-like isoform X1 n=1 Tax=Ptychodera flava TaxID=63121 RepID=UPI00396A04E4
MRSIICPLAPLAGQLVHVVRFTGSRRHLHADNQHKMASPTLKPLKRVGILGGTHGNELSGVYLVKKWLKDKTPVTRSTFETTVCISNPRAVEKCVRYIDTDLNRVFTEENLRADVEIPSDTNVPYEILTARKLNKVFGPMGPYSGTDFMLDLHNTTSNMRNCIILEREEDALTTHLANYLQKLLPCPLFLKHNRPKDGFRLVATVNLAKHGISIEIGPQAHGTLVAEVYQRMEEITHHALDFIEKFNQGHEFPECTVEAHRILEKVDFPRDKDGELTAMIHPKFQDKDWEPLNPGDPIFLSFNGETISYKGDTTVYPAFINEASYYEKGLAFWAMEKVKLTAPTLKVQE